MIALRRRRFELTTWVAQDLAFAIVFLCLMGLELAARHDDDAVIPTARLAVLIVVMAAAVAVRRRYPLGAYVVNGLALSAHVASGFGGDIYPWTNAAVLYAVSSHAPRGQALVGLVLAGAGTTFYQFALPQPSDGIDLVATATAWVVVWVVGQAVASHRARMAAEAHARATAAEAGVVAERGRMARELHDSIGHAMNVIVLHAGAGRTVVTDDPEIARQAFATIEAAGRQALGELDHVIGVLRRGEDELTADHTMSASWHPAPGAADLQALCDRMDGEWLGVELAVVGTPRALPAAVDLAVHRIVQESLTNTIKHATAASAWVGLEYGPADVTVEVRDDGRGLRGTPLRGRGLSGVGERVAALGGELEIDTGPEGGLRLRCLLPITAAATPAAAAPLPQPPAGP